MNKQLFEDLGFSQGEIKVYFALLELGESTIGPISKSAKVTAAKTYPILEKLKEKLIIGNVIKSGTTHFQILNPKRIINYIEEKEEKLKEEKQKVEKILPQLLSKQKPKDRQYSKVYEGFNGIKTLYDEMLEYFKNSKEDFIAFTLGEEYKREEANLFFKNYDAKRKALGIKMKIIGHELQKPFIDREYGPNPNIELKYAKTAIPTGVIIFGDSVATLLWKDIPTAFVIHSKQNAQVYRKFFYDTWKTAKKGGKK